MKNAKAFCLASCFLLSACGDTKGGISNMSAVTGALFGKSTINPKIASCHTEQGKAEIISKDDGVVWTSISKFINAGSEFRAKAENRDGYKQPMTVNFINQTCTVGNPNSDGSLVFVLKDKFPDPAI